MHDSMKRLVLAGLGLALMIVAAPARADVTIDFATLGGANGDPFTGPYTENGFTVTPTGGNWFVAQVFGNPIPDIFAGPIGSPSTSTVEVTKVGGGTFTLSAADFASNNGDSNFTFAGFLGGNPEYSNSGGLTSNAGFITTANASAGVTVDAVFITITPTGQPTSMNLDNIVVNAAAAVPEPSSALVAVVTASMVGFVAARRGRKKAN